MTHHAIVVAAPRRLGAEQGPWLLQRDDDDFINAVLAEARADDGGRLAATRASARTGTGVLKLFQPVQRRFHVALVEAWCDTAGAPRIDPARVDAAGLVLRRLRHSEGRAVMEGWMRADGIVRGWTTLQHVGGEEADPLPEQRLAAAATGVGNVDRALRRLAETNPGAALQEDVTPLFLAPPDVCGKTRQSLFYGVVATASSELAQAAPDLDALFAGFDAQSQAFRAHLVQPLRGMEFQFPLPPLAGRRFDSTWLDALKKASAPSVENRFMLLLRQLVTEFDLFGAGAASKQLLAELAQVRLHYALQPGEIERRSTAADAFLREASRVLLEGGEGSVELPELWPSLPSDATERLATAMSAAMRERFHSVHGRPGRFDEPDARYVVRAFVRLKPEGACPARIHWSGYSEPFVIAPWYEGAGDPVQIALPDMSRATLQSLKPNVAFVVPPPLQELLNGNPEDLAKGKSDADKSVTLGWICSFSLPVITLCAFICLNVFLSLFDLIFRWMLFIKICIPYPKVRSGGAS